MSRGYGRAGGAHLAGGVSRGKHAGARRPAAQNGGGAEGFPGKYLASSPQRVTPSRAGAAGARISLTVAFAVLVLLMVSITFQLGDSGTGIDLQLAVRLAGYGLAALFVLYAVGMRRLHFSRGLLAAALVPIFITATAIYAPERAFALSAGLAHLALFLFAWQMVSRFGQERAVRAVVIAGTIIGALSIFVFYMFPDIGQTAADRFSGEPAGRMRGITPRPNWLGLVSAFTLLFAIMYFRTFTTLQRVFAAGAVCIAAFCLVYSVSRTSAFAVLLCVGMWRLYRSNLAYKLYGVLGLALVACLLIGFVPDLTPHLSREGRSNDLASFNGRWYIWEVAWEWIKEYPWLGQGYGASQLILQSDARDRLFAAAVNVHNVYLELLFSGGVVLFMLYAIVILMSLVRAVRDDRAEALVAVIFFMIVGSTDSTPFSGLPLFPAAAFYIAISLCLAPSRQDRWRVTNARKGRWPVNRRVLPASPQMA